MYYTINTIVPKKRDWIAGLSVLIGLVIAGYVMIALLVLANDSLEIIKGKLNNYEILYRHCANLTQFTK